MEKTLIILDESKNFVRHNNKRYYYELYSGRLWKYFNIEKLLSDDTYFKEAHNLGFNNYEKKFMSDYNELYRRIEKKFYIPISKNFIEFYKLNWDEEGSDNGYIIISNTHLNEDTVDSFYEFSIEVEINNFRTAFTRSFAFENMIYIEVPENENFKSKMIRIFGEPQNIPELESEKYGSGKRYFYFIVPKSGIDKIIGIKKYRDTSTFGQYDGEKFTGEVEEFVLDLNNFDKNVYTLFKEHGMIEIEGY